ncbi:MAG: hypothetical protein HPY45_15225 [Anaerolineae bacterium]|nr:hypothetical protein [Anaerolineae bacterium]
MPASLCPAECLPSPVPSQREGSRRTGFTQPMPMAMGQAPSYGYRVAVADANGCGLTESANIRYNIFFLEETS